jgi:hypothetical protein
MRESTMRLVITPIKQARAKKISANCVRVEILILYKIAEIKGKVNRKKNLLNKFISGKYIVKKFINFTVEGDVRKEGSNGKV